MSRNYNESDQTDRNLCFPSAINDLAAVYLALLQYSHAPVFRHVDSVHIATRLDAEGGTSTTRWEALHSWDIDVLASVKLESWLSARYLKMDLGLRMEEGGYRLQSGVSSIKRDAGGIGVDDEAVVDVRLLLTQGERSVGLDTRVLFDGSCGDPAIIDDLVFVRDQSSLCTRNSWRPSEIKVTEQVISETLNVHTIALPHLWLVMLTAVAGASSPTSSASYSICNTSFWTPFSFSCSCTYQTRTSTVPG
jgi:hypothetical protein